MAKTRFTVSNADRNIISGITGKLALMLCCYYQHRCVGQNCCHALAANTQKFYVVPVMETIFVWTLC